MSSIKSKSKFTSVGINERKNNLYTSAEHFLKDAKTGSDNHKHSLLTMHFEVQIFSWLHRCLYKQQILCNMFSFDSDCFSLENWQSSKLTCLEHKINSLTKREKHILEKNLLYAYCNNYTLTYVTNLQVVQAFQLADAPYLDWSNRNKQ